MKFDIEYDIEDDGRWIAEVPSIPGALSYGITKEDAAAKVISIALNIFADKLEISNLPKSFEISLVPA